MRSLLVLCLLVASTYAYTLGKTVINPTLNWRVVGGSDAPDGAYPHQISLRKPNSHSCGGSIIDKNCVVTAAHCVRGSSPNNMKIVAGSNKLSTGGTSYQVREVHVHEQYNPSTALNDVAVLKVDDIAFTEKVNKIPLETEDVGGDVPVDLSGWGSMRLGGATPDDLQHINLKSTTVQQCQIAHIFSGRPIEATQICTLTKSGEGACHGDSGGPLMTINKDGSHKLAGIVSWGQPCARGYPDVFARVPSYVDWIKEKCNL